VHVPSATGGSNADGRPTADLSIRELFDLNSYWLAINILWGALGISLLPILIIDTVCGGDQVCGDPTPILGSIVAPKGTAEAIITTLGVLVAILVQPTVAAISDHTSTRIGRRKPFIIVGTILDMVFLLGFYLAGAWIGLLIFYVLLQFSSNFAQGPFQGYMPDLVPARQVGLARSPSLCSSERQWTALRSPRLPSARGTNLGTTNNEIPLTLSGAPARLASTRWMMFSARSCSPDEMKILVPVIE